jgi:(p)ppGpp synthase/HD superfamily hydrolase
MSEPALDRPAMGPRFQEALQYASNLHRRQVRKGTRIPYVSHLLAVASLVMEDGGGEDEAIAGLLHDAVEDQGGRKTLEEIRRRFGEQVAQIVEGCTDADTIPKPPWRERKEKYIAHVRTASREVLRVSAADKLHNARAVLADYRTLGEALWDRFNGGRKGTLWYYRELTSVYKEAGVGLLAEELDRVVSELERLASIPTVP